ncbi:hypothetical protein EXM98_19165 [Clostridium botulinum]|nr:hypothetical protein [Clostridium botulinum]NFC62316.1 hypothetical protein [Clostridium botulinum]NFC71274.1 hypothetical protein [Clostridium botulinum]NFE38985.1 hypothetical protein [Clostridium botulinum]NFE43631.1 hypothetical protein [Clostridium botulinum]
MLNGQKNTTILKVNNGSVRLCDDTVTESYSIALRTNKDMEFKFISKELYNLLIKELIDQVGTK